MHKDATHTQPELLRVADVSRRLGVHRSTAYRLIHSGEIPAVRVGGSIRIDPRELEQYVYGDTITNPPTGGVQGSQDPPVTAVRGISGNVPQTFGDA